MSEPGLEHQLANDERRRQRRRRVLLTGRLADATGAQVTECVISNLSLTGAQVRLCSDDPLPSYIYLVDVKTHQAHLAATTWRRGDRMGLCFRETIDVDGELPERLSFLKRVLVEAKLKQIEQLAHKGFTLDHALEAIGATRSTYERWRREGLLHENTRTTLERLVIEYRTLLKLLASARDVKENG